MGSTTSTGALIDILNLCAETLTSLRSKEEDGATATRPDKIRFAGQRANTGTHLVLIPGGLSSIKHRSPSR